MIDSLVYLFGYLVEYNNEKKIKLHVNSNDNIINTGLVIISVNESKIKDGYFMENTSDNIKFKENHILISDKKYNYSDLKLTTHNDNIYLDLSLFELCVTNLINKFAVELNDNISIDNLIVHKNGLFVSYNDNFIYELDLMDNMIIFDKKYNRFVIYEMGFKNKIDIKNMDLVVKYNINFDQKLDAIIYLEYPSLNYTSILGYCKISI